MDWSSSIFSKFVYVSDPRISKDGGKIAYAISKVRLEDDEYDKTVVVEDLESESRVYIEGSMPRFHPEGNSIFFVAEEGEKKILKIMDISTASSRTLTKFDSIEDYTVDPSGRFLAVLTREKPKDEPALFLDDVPVWFDEMGFLNKPRVVLKVLDSKSGEVLNESEITLFSTVIWHGEKILVSSPIKEYGFWKFYDVYTIDPLKGDREYILQKTSLRAVDSDGETVLMIGKPEKRNVFEHNFLYVYKNGKVSPLYENQIYNVVSAKISRTGIFFTNDEMGKITLKMYRKGKIEYIFNEDAWVDGFDVDISGRIVFTVETEFNPGEVYFWNGRYEKKTSYNESIVKIFNLPKAEKFSFKSLDLEIDGWFIKSKEKDPPVVLFVHGGPKGMYGHRFNFTMIDLVKSGFDVVYFNPRGSTGYDEDFALRVVGRTGMEDFQDIMNGLDVFLNDFRDETDRIGITGISYGGFMTNWAITQTKRFKAAVSENGISSWFNMYGVSDISLWFVKELIGDEPLSNPLYSKLSPITYVKNVQTPLLLIHSMEDYRCPVDQSMMFYNALKDIGKEAYLAIFKKGAHGHSLRAKPKHRRYRYELVKEFFKSKLLRNDERFEWKGVKV